MRVANQSHAVRRALWGHSTIFKDSAQSDSTAVVDGILMIKVTENGPIGIDFTFLNPVSDAVQTRLDIPHP